MMMTLPHQRSRTFAARLARDGREPGVPGAGDATQGQRGDDDVRRVLVVDDEPRVLHALRRSLATITDRWELDFAADGGSAIEALERRPSDIIISDMRMPGMTGVELLGHVRQRWPGTLRVMLSGMGEGHVALQAMDAVHQYLPKPCDTSELFALVERCRVVQGLLGSAALQRLVGRIGHLPPTPVVYCELLRCLSQQQASARSVAGIIARDPALAAKLLQVANSAFFRRGRPVSDIGVAVTHIGLDLLRTLVLMVEVFSSPSDEGAAVHLQQRALRAMLIAEHIAAGTAFHADAITAALLCDVGQLIPGIEAHCLDAERRGEGRYRPCDVAAYLLALWGLPMPLVVAVATHERPAAMASRRFDATGAAHVALALARGVEPDAEYLAQVGQAARLDGWKQFAARLSTREAG